MSVVTLQIGQCGNQICGQLFSTIYNDIVSKDTGTPLRYNEEYASKSLDRFFCCESAVPEPRAIMVDMEQKVIAKTVDEAEKTGSCKFIVYRWQAKTVSGLTASYESLNECLMKQTAFARY